MNSTKMKSQSHSISTSRERHTGIARRLTLCLLAMCTLVLPPLHFLSAQPVPVPALSTPTYQATDFDPFFNTAQGSATQASWETLMDQARILLGAQWEAQVDATIGAHIASVGQNDYFHTVAEYRDYLTKELHLQKQTAYAAWEAQADIQIETQREVFLAALSEKKKREALEQSEQTTESADTTQNDLSPQQQAWEDEFEQSVENGFQQFQSALGDVYAQYSSFLQTLADKETEFENNRLQIEAYEQTVRNGIQSTVHSLNSYLNSNGLFRQENCTTAGAAGTQSTTCTTDMTTFNTAGTRLQTLITNLQDGLDNDTPLSTLATLMNDYLDQEHTDAINRRNYWGGLIRNTYTFQQRDYNTGGNPYGIGDVQSVFQARNSGYGNFTGLAAMIARNGDPRVVEGVNNADIMGYSYNYNAGPDQVGHSGTNEWYSTHGDNAFRFNWERRHEYWYRCGAYLCRGTYTSHHTANEAHVEIRASYNWYDPNADHNNQVWGGYVNDINPVLANWRDNIVPAIQNWEAQVAAYTANHQAYLANAATQRAAAQAQYDTSIETLTESRNKWLSQMQEEYRKGRSEWVSMGQTARRAASVSAPTQTFVSEAAGFTEQLAFLQQQAEKNSVASVPVPDASGLAELQTAFQKAAKGIVNLSLAATLNDQVVDQRTAITESIAEAIGRNGLDGLTDEQLRTMAQQTADQTGQSVEEVMEAMRKDANDRQFDVRIDEYGRIIATRQIKSGRIGGVTGDGTGYDNYSAEMMEQEMIIAPPPAVKLVKTASAFDDWDANSYINDHFENQKDQNEVLENYNNYVAGEQELANDIRESQDKIYNAHVQASMTAAQNNKKNSEKFKSLVNSVASGMMGGQSFEQAFGTASNQQFSDEIARLTGIPSNFFNGVLNGESWQRSLTSATEYLVTDYVTNAVVEATGLPAGFISGIAGPGGLDMSGEGMKAAFQNYSEALFVEKLEEQTGIDGLGALVLERHEKEQKKRAFQRDGLRNPYAGARYLMTETPAGRTMTNTALGYLSGRTLGSATGLPPAMFNPLGAVIPQDVDELDDTITDAENVANGRVDGRELSEKYQDRWDNWVDANVNAVEDLGKLTLADLPAKIGSGITGYLSAGMGMIMKPLTALVNPPKPQMTEAELRVRESMTESVTEATGLGSEYVRSLVVDGADLETAVKAQFMDNMTTTLFGDNIPDQFRAQVRGEVAGYINHAIERYQFQKDKAKAAAVRPEDAATMGATYIWRNAQYGSKDQQMALQVAEVGAGVAASVLAPGVGTAAFIAYMSAKQGYQGSLEGGLMGGLAGIASGAGNAILGHYTGGLMNFSLSYSHEGGFGGSLGVGYDVGGGVNVGASLNFQEGEGITGASLTAGYSKDGGDFGPDLGGDLNLNFDAEGTFQGGSISGSVTGDTGDPSQNVNASLGMNFGSDLSATGVTANLSLSGDNELPNGLKSTYKHGAGLTFNRDGTSSFNFSQSIGLADTTRAGFNKAGTNVNNTINFDAGGNLDTIDQSISMNASIQTQEDAENNILRLEDEALEELAQETDPQKRADLEKLLDGLDDARRLVNIEYARLRTAQERLIEAGRPDMADLIETMPELLENDAFRDKFFAADDRNAGEGTSRLSGLSKALGAIGDEMKFLVGGNSSADGFVDSDGMYHERTCFTAGTPVRVQAGTRGAFQQNGSWYKNIEAIEIGDRVLSWNEDSREISFEPVIETFTNTTTLVYNIEYPGKLAVETTWNHPFYIEGRGWTEVKDLRSGDLSHTPETLTYDRTLAFAGSHQASASSHNSKFQAVRRITHERREATVYNIEVANNHTYFVTDGDLLVHNYEIIDKTVEAAHRTKNFVFGEDEWDTNRTDYIDQVPCADTGLCNYGNMIVGVLNAKRKQSALIDRKSGVIPESLNNEHINAQRDLADLVERYPNLASAVQLTGAGAMYLQMNEQLLGYVDGGPGDLLAEKYIPAEVRAELQEGDYLGALGEGVWAAGKNKVDEIKGNAIGDAKMYLRRRMRTRQMKRFNNLAYTRNPITRDQMLHKASKGEITLSDIQTTDEKYIEKAIEDGDSWFSALTTLKDAVFEDVPKMYDEYIHNDTQLSSFRVNTDEVTVLRPERGLLIEKRKGDPYPLIQGRETTPFWFPSSDQVRRKLVEDAYRKKYSGDQQPDYLRMTDGTGYALRTNGNKNFNYPMSSYGQRQLTKRLDAAYNKKNKATSGIEYNRKGQRVHTIRTNGTTNWSIPTTAGGIRRMRIYNEQQARKKIAERSARLGRKSIPRTTRTTDRSGKPVYTYRPTDKNFNYPSTERVKQRMRDKANRDAVETRTCHTSGYFGGALKAVERWAWSNCQ